MADPLSITASLIAVGQVVGGIIVSCYSYQERTRNARRDASRILIETRALRHVTESLLTYVIADESRGDAVSSSLARIIGGDESLFMNCQKALVSLEQRLQTPVNKWKSLGDQLLWPLRESEIAKEIENIHRMRNVIESGLAIDTAASIRSIQRDTRELKERILDLKNQVEMTVTQRLQVMLDWLGAFNPSAYHNMVRENRTEGTGKWLLQGQEFERWRESTEMTFLWMHGIPGCGKSVLAASVIDYIRESTTVWDNATSLAYYYFQFGHQHISSVHSMLRSLISQLSFRNGLQPPAALDECALRHFSIESNHMSASTIYVEGVSQPTTSDLVSVLRGILEELDEVYLVMDGFDECMDQGDLLHLVDDMLKWNPRNVHVFVTGRYQHELDIILEARNSLVIEMDGQNVSPDIQLFIQNQLTSHPKLRKWPPGLQAKIHESLTKGSQGMFRWVSCQVEVIAKCITPRDLVRALESLPKSLSAAYTSILAQIDELHWEYATKILLWLAVSSQPLLIGEAVDGLAIDLESDNPAFDPDLRIQDVGDVINMCATLVTPCRLVQKHGRALEEFTELRLAHHTVKDYLLSDFFKAQFAQPIPFVGKAQVHEFVAKTSISYLLSLHEPLVPALLNERPLSRRAAQFWLGHYVEAEKHQGLTCLAMKLLESDEPYRNWCRLYDPTRPWKAPNLDRAFFPEPLYYVSNCGVQPLVSTLLQAGSDPAAKGEIHASCLQSAVWNGHLRIVEVLLQAGANPDVGGGLRDSPLSAAVDSGQTEIMKMLLERGADPDGPDFGFAKGYILRQACLKNNTLAVELLINAGASPNHYLRKVKYPTALEIVTHRGFQECMRLLLPKSSRSIALRGLQVACREHGTPEMLEIFKDKVPDAVFYHAISLGLEKLAGNMMEYGVTQTEVDRSDDGRLRESKDYSRAGALYCACKLGNLGLVQKLVEDGVDVNVDDERCGPSLAVAAYQGHTDVVKFLIDSGASLTNCNGKYGGPAQAAVLGNHLQVLELVVSAGADINMPVEFTNLNTSISTHMPRLGSPLQAAIYMENDTTVEWVLKHGANVNYGGGCGGYPSCTRCGPPLLIASSQGNVNLVDRLLEAGAEVNQQAERVCGGWRTSTALEGACLEGHVSVVERLIRGGAAIDLEGEPDRGSRPLAFAIEADSLDIVALLLRNGATPNSLSPKCEEDVTLLAQACQRANASIVSALIQAGADVHETSRFVDDDEPPIQTAASHSNVDVIRVLLKHGANVNDQTSEGFTALHKAARRGCAPILRVLLSEGLADYSLRLINGSQPIHTAARWNHPDCIQALVEAGADINSRNDSGKTPLHWATEHQAADAIEWLLSNGADAGLAEYGTNLTPYDYAALRLEKAESWEREDAIEILELFS